MRLVLIQPISSASSASSQQLIQLYTNICSLCKTARGISRREDVYLKRCSRREMLQVMVHYVFSHLIKKRHDGNHCLVLRRGELPRLKLVVLQVVVLTNLRRLYDIYLIHFALCVNKDNFDWNPFLLTPHSTFSII